jgi:hypothetical protein
MNRSEQKRYSLLRAIESVAKNGKVTGFEAEISAQIARSSGKEARGFYVPLSIFNKRDVLTTSPSNGSNIIAEDYLQVSLLIACANRWSSVTWSPDDDWPQR